MTNSSKPTPVSIGDLAGHERARRFEGRDHGSTISCFVSSNKRSTGPSLHRHPYEETFVVLKGSVAFSVEGETVEVEAGHIVIVPAGAVHGFKSTSDELLQVSIHPSDHTIQEWLEE